MKTLSVLAILTAVPAMKTVAAEPVKWTIDAAGKGLAVSPTMHGIFFEDINYAADGGLYAELVENRSFEHKIGMYAWREEKRGGATGHLTLTNGAPIHPNNPRFLHLEVTNAGKGYGVSNLGYGGIPLSPGVEYRFSVQARSLAGYSGALLVKLEAQDGTVLGEGKIDKVGSKWTRHQIALTSKVSNPAARLTVLADAAGQLDIDMVSLFPKDTWKGRENGLRADLVQALADLKPGFMRFPGGCVVEGNDLPNAYRWKDTVGDISTRKQNWNRWTNGDVNKPDGQYHQTYGLGFYEFFQLCEDIGASPVPVLNCGMSCQFQAKQLVPLEQIDPWVQDALDLVEFANGPVTSKWGKLRADMGHPASFHMKHLGVGNEQWGDQYFERYPIFYRALKAAHPEITLITTSGPGVDDGNWKFAWNKFHTGTPADIVDEHYYRPPTWFLENAGRYESYDRKGPKVFAGEFAAHRQDRKSTLDSAVSEAAFMTGLLANADVVSMSCFAPLLAREGFTQWAPDLIWFDQTRVMKTPSYHVQAMFGNNRPDVVVPSKLESNSDEEKNAGLVGVGTWISQAEYKDIVVRQGNKVVFQPDVSNGLNNWQNKSGKWSVRDGALYQEGDQQPAMLLAGDPTWTDYTLSLKARKTSGKEGFLILFRTADEKNRCWWNIGGWGNTAHAIEMPGYESPRIPGSIETNRWYDIRVEVAGGHIRCYLDGTLIHDITRSVRQKIYAVAGIDQADHELILQLSNPHATASEIDVDLQGWPAGKEAHGQVLTSASPNDLNTLAAPQSVAPREVKLTLEGASLKYTLPAWSHTVLRVSGSSKN
ncbi:MAG: alpha-L-arabinofuranosidase C-terminal domain-containing protein [Luteolibacter sp.]